MKRIVILVVLLLTNPFVRAQVCFSPVTNYTLGGQPMSIASDDFNNDTYLDLAVVRETANDIAILFGSASGTFTLNSNVSVGGSLPVSVVTKDLNSDGQEDLIVAVNTNNIVRILYGSSAGTFVLGPSYGVGASPFEVVVADFNNDAKFDVISANYSANQVSVYFGTGAGTFTGGIGVGVSTQPAGVFCGDFNNDGNMDFATTNSGANNISIKLGNGAGAFSGSATFNVGSSPRGIDGGDLNGDGILDLVITNYSSGNVSVLIGVGTLGVGTGSFLPAVNYPSSNGSQKFKLADINGDMKLDAVIPTYSTTSVGNIAILLGTGSGLFSGPLLFPVGPYAHQVCCKDFNNDGRIDVANASIDPPYIVSVYLNSNLILSPSSQTICSGNTAVITASGVSTYTWSNTANTSSITVSPSVTTVYSVSGTNSLNCTGAFRNATVIVNPTPTLTVNNATICAGDSTIINVSGANTYTWNTGSNSTSLTVSPTTSVIYTVIGSTTNSCLSSSNSSVLVNQLPIVTISSNPPILCVGETATLTASGANTYTWISNIIGNNLIVSPSVTTVYTLVGSDANMCKNSNIYSLNVDPNPTLSIVGNTFVCALSQVNLAASGAVSYSWNTGSNNSSIIVSPSVTTIYTVTGFNSFSCKSTQTIQVNTTALDTPSICLVTVDSLSINNEIYWEKTNYPQADTFIVYRESNASLYSPIARIPKSAFSSYIDTNRSIGPNNGNPNFTAYKYKLQYRDSCGNLSALSPYHKTIFITDYQTGNFSWNYYYIEGIGDVQTVNYNLWRQSILTGSSVLIGGTSNNSFTDPNYSTLAQSGNVKWFVNTTGFNCNPSQKSHETAAGKNGTKSNNSNERQFPSTLGIGSNKNINTLISIFPNPTQGRITINFGVQPIQVSIELKDIFGRIVLKETANSQIVQLYAETINNGVYFLCLYDQGNLIKTEKIIVQHP